MGDWRLVKARPTDISLYPSCRFSIPDSPAQRQPERGSREIQEARTIPDWRWLFWDLTLCRKAVNIAR